jgi:hypothetical protein
MRVGTRRVLLVALVVVALFGTITTGVRAAGQGAIAGVVRALDGKPLPGICVVAFDEFGRFTVDLTDNIGRYRLDLVPEPHRIGAIGCRNDKYGAVYYPYKFSWDTAGVIDIQEGVARAVDFKLPRGAEVVGHLTDEKGQSVTNTWVETIPTSVPLFIGHGIYVSGDPLIFGGFTRVDANGDYHLRGLTPGPFKVRYFPDSDDYTVQYAHNKYGFPDGDSIDLHSRKNFLNQVIHRAGVVTGRITGSNGQPASNVAVRADYYLDLYGLFGHTDENGYYEMRGASTGNHQVWFDPFWGGAPYAPEYFDNVPSRTGHTPYFIRTGATRVLNVELARQGTISGVVTNNSGHPLAQVCVSTGEAAGSYVSFTETDTAGRFVLPNLNAGTFEVTFSDCNPALPNYPAKYVSIKARAAQDTKVAVKLERSASARAPAAASSAWQPGPPSRQDVAHAVHPEWWSSIPAS